MSQSTLTIIRRVIVVTGLLSLPAQRYCFQHLGLIFLPFEWGWVVETAPVVVAVWFVSRDRLWDSWYGWFRALVYATAAIGGWLLLDLPYPTLGVFWFGTFSALSLTWFLMPMRLFLGRRLVDSRPAPRAGRSFNIRWVQLWIMIAAVSLAILAEQGQLVGLYRPSVILPLQLLHSFAALMIMIGLAGRWYHSLLGLMAGTFAVLSGTQILMVIWSQISVDFEWGVSAPWLRSYCAGRLTAAFLVFALARITGLRFQRVPSREEAG